MGWLTNWQLTGAPNRCTQMNADRDLQDKNLVGSPDRFAKTAGSRNSLLSHVYPYYIDLNVHMQMKKILHAS